MTNELQVLNFEDKKIHMFEQNGEPWFSGKDVAKALGYTRARNAVRDHVSKNDKMALSNLPEHQNDARVNGGYGDTQIYVNEAGIYSLIFSSKLPAAEKFKDWVTHEVLPSIRKHGMYLTEKTEETLKTDPEAFDELVKLYCEEKEKARQLQEKIENERSFVTLGKIVLALQGSLSIKDTAGFLAQKGIEIGQNRLYKFCREKGLTCKSKGKNWNKPSQRAIEKGILGLQLENGINAITMVTPKGLQYLSDIFMSEQMPIIFMIETNEKEETEETQKQK